ncbi:hypothetical protein NT6N_03250 [Oceaniferula spumae]|uniref:Uncharacterized protein n=1 Tax=Oceaniferula spumae TaxID=2979115 RepID=A0AAT9FH34_9BACT
MNPNDYIPKPCHENWNAMSGDEKRKFCAKCSTHVHDLSEKSAEEIRSLHEANGGKLCGSFKLRSSLALGSGIASLALASCNSDKGAHRPDQPGPRLAGAICPPPEQTDHGDKAKPKHKFAKPPGKGKVVKPKDKPVKKIVPPEPMLLGEIHVPERERFPEA